MMLTIIIELDNDAFTGRQGSEVSRILKVLREDIWDNDELAGYETSLRDFNGNYVGCAEVTE